jgi:STE24 endopeptidase
MKSDSCLILILLLYILKESFEYVVQYLNLMHMRKCGSSVPDEFKGEIDEGLMKKTREYEAEHTRFGFLSSFFGNIVTVVFLFSGLLNIYNSWVVSLRLPFILSGWLFFMILFYANEILSIPFSLYNTFRIENRYGFNTTTFRLWVSDLTKSLILSMLLLSIVLPAGLWIIQRSPSFWWLWVWSFLFLFSMFVMYISPYVIEPLFNKFTPLENLSLREGILRLLEKAGIRADRILRVDASKRSLHTNAYFTGIGKTKRIVLYDTLLERMNSEEVLSVLAHEIGHWKKRHILKTMALFEVLSVIALYLSYRFMQGNSLTTLFHIEHQTFLAKALILAFLAGILILPLRPILNNYIRRHEKEADITSQELTNDRESMVRALIKLSKDNLSNLHPHPLYVSLYYSHPPILERIRYIRSLGTKEE